MGALRRLTDKIIIHCSATKPDMDIGASEIDDWHRQKGWAGIGYHRVIRRDGTIERGRHLDFAGAHARPWNYRSVGVCLVGGVNGAGKAHNNFTAKQWKALRKLINDLKTFYPDAEIIGHRDVPGVNKACPTFDVSHWLKE